MAVTLQRLLADRRFNLALIAGSGERQLDADIVWAHSSDLHDPTPWLEPGQLLLTDGAQFGPDRRQVDAADYVARLRGRGVLALGFATGIIHDEIPTALMRACEEQGLVLIEVAERTPFMAIIRYVADEIARDQRVRLEWSMTAQRAIARAATRPDGLSEILRELETRLDGWVVLFDALGERIGASAEHRVPHSLAAQLHNEVELMLTRRSRAASTISVLDDRVTLQSIGRRGRLDGVLAVGSRAPLDPAGSDLVASVIALASIALEQNRTIREARRALRSSLVELVLAGEIEAARRVAGPVWGRLPADPVRLALVRVPEAPDELLAELDLLADRRGARMFVAERGSELLIIAPDGDDEVERIIVRHGVAAGISAPVGWGGLAVALQEARRAVARVPAGGGALRFDAIVGDGLLGLLAQAGARDVAQRVLGPVRTSGRPDADLLLQSAATWIAHNGTWDHAARALGIHRHTLRSRIAAVEELLALDLNRFVDRAELWAALEFSGVEPISSAGTPG